MGIKSAKEILKVEEITNPVRELKKLAKDSKEPEQAKLDLSSKE